MLDNQTDICNNSYTMAKQKKKQPTTATEIIRQAILESGVSFAEMERQSGVKRQSLMKFARSEQSLRLDMVDMLLPCLGLELAKKQGGK